MTLQTILDELRKPSQHPSYPGLGKSPLAGFICGCALGILGVGVYLRNWTDPLLAFLACIVLAVFMSPGFFTAVLMWILCGLWVVGRIKLSTSRYLAQMAMTTQPPPKIGHAAVAGAV